MATFFGEILPDFSRAVDDEEEDDDQFPAPPSSILRWSPEANEEISQKGCIQCGVIIIAIGQAATSFTETYIMATEKSETLGVICSGMGDDDVCTLSQTASTDKTCYIHRLLDKPEIIIVQCKGDVAPEQAYSWTDQMLGQKLKLLPQLDHPDKTYVCIMSSQASSTFTSDRPHGDLPSTFLRALKTSHFKATPLAPYLDQPNIVSGLPAQILSFCQCHGLPGVLYTCYTDVPYLDIVTIKAFRLLLKASPLKEIIQENPSAESHLQKLIHQQTEHNSLYT